MRRTRKSYVLVLVAAVVALLFSSLGTGVSLAQEHDDDHGGGGGSGDPSDPDIPPYGPPPANRNPGEQRTTVRQGPFYIPAPGPGEHHGHTGNQFAVGEKPCSNCQITSMTAKLVNAAGEEIGNPQNLQLHHMVLLQRQTGRDDATCGGLSFPVPFGLLFGERFFASGDERTPVTMPVGYGYPVGTGGWTLIYELANGNDTAQSAYIEMTYDYVPGNTLKTVDPVWFDIDQCGVSAVSTPAGQFTRQYTWTVNRPGDLIAAGGHQHGNWINGAVDGGTRIELRRGGAFGSGEVLCDSVAGYETSSFYTDGHGMSWLESMSKCGGDAGEAVSLGELSAGEQVTMVGHYDQQNPWSGQMGIMIAYIAPDGVDGEPPGNGGNDDCNWLAELLGWC